MGRTVIELKGRVRQPSPTIPRKPTWRTRPTTQMRAERGTLRVPRRLTCEADHAMKLDMENPEHRKSLAQRMTAALGPVPKTVSSNAALRRFVTSSQARHHETRNQKDLRDAMARKARAPFETRDALLDINRQRSEMRAESRTRDQWDVSAAPRACSCSSNGDFVRTRKQERAAESPASKGGSGGTAAPEARAKPSADRFGCSV